MASGSSSGSEQTPKYTINVSSNIRNAGTLKINGETIPSKELDINSLCTLKAIPNSNHLFVNWSHNGTVVGNEYTYGFTVSDSTAGNYVANFSIKNNSTNVSANISVQIIDESGNDTTLYTYSPRMNNSNKMSIKINNAYCYGSEPQNETITFVGNNIPLANPDTTGKITMPLLYFYSYFHNKITTNSLTEYEIPFNTFIQVSESEEEN